MGHKQLPRVDLFGECITRSCTIKAVEKGALNLSQGFPEEEPRAEVKNAACEAIQRGPNQYADMRGSPALRRAVAEQYRTHYGMEWVDADANVTITCGTTEAMAASVLATAGPGDEVIIEEPTYENYPPQALLAGATVRYLAQTAPDWSITREALDAAFGPRTKVFILNTPNNPTGRVYAAAELSLVAEYCNRYDTIALVDEIYEHLIWDGRQHIRLATLEGMRERTVTISGISKTYAATGWRVGWTVAPREITLAIRRVHDFLTATVPTPLQAAAVEALRLPPSYYSEVVTSYERRRALLAGYLDASGLSYELAEGAYYLFPTCEGLRFRDSVEFADSLLNDAGVAVVPYTAFYKTPGKGQHRFRVNFAKSEATLTEAGSRIAAFCKDHRG